MKYYSAIKKNKIISFVTTWIYLEAIMLKWNVRQRKTNAMWFDLYATPVFLPGESQGWGSLMGCHLWGHTESDMTEGLHFHLSLSCIGEGNGKPLQCSCLENPRDRGAWWAAIYGVTQSRTLLKRLSSSSMEKEMATHSSVVAWRIPGTGDPDGLPSVGSHRVGHDWSDLAAAAVVRD